LREVVGRWRFDLVLSSPPYGGTYDYVDHHARRYPWLGLSAEALCRAELGARRDLSGSSDREAGRRPDRARGQDRGQGGGRERGQARGPGRDQAQRWTREVQTALSSIASVLSPRGRVVLLVGDAEVGGRRISAAQQLDALAERAGLRVI